MIKIVDGKPYLNQVKELIQEYTKWLGRDLAFQNLDKELADRRFLANAVSECT